jgi:hypothetical protein
MGTCASGGRKYSMVCKSAPLHHPIRKSSIAARGGTTRPSKRSGQKRQNPASGWSSVAGDAVVTFTERFAARSRRIRQTIAVKRVSPTR